MRLRVVAWLVAALLGLVVAACLTFAASQLSSQHVGLSDEPLSAGRGLAPQAHDRPAAPRGTPATTRPSRTRPGGSHGGDDREGSGGDD